MPLLPKSKKSRTWKTTHKQAGAADATTLNKYIMERWEDRVRDGEKGEKETRVVHALWRGGTGDAVAVRDSPI